MTGTFGGALEARKVDASGGRLNALARGEVEVEDGVLVIKRIHITFHIRARAADRGTIERVHGFYASKCPVYRSIQAAIAVTSSFELEEEQP